MRFQVSLTRDSGKMTNQLGAGSASTKYFSFLLVPNRYILRVNELNLSKTNTAPLALASS